MGIIAWIIFGGLAGWVASLIMKTDAQQGVFLNVIVGIIGAFIGGFIMHALGDETNFDFNIGSFLVAVLGAIVLLFIVKLVTGGTRT
jgi:uncharacterized membrane protein YeaQ/YmgE (transglycosylase-associated protein family)